MSSLPPPSAPASASTYVCPYCRLDSDPTGRSCPHCGAPVDIRAKVSVSGWERQPSINDLARIQFGQSVCQVSGTYVPVAEMRLAAGDSIYFSHHVLLWAEPNLHLGQQSLKGAWNRMYAGLPLVMMEAHGPGTLALSDNHPGETIAVPLMPGRSIDVREHRFMVATQNVTYDWFDAGIWYTTKNGDETETHYPVGRYVDRFAAQGTPGLLMLHSPGNVFVRDLAAGETICFHPGALVWKDSSVGMSMHLERPRGTSFFTMWQPATPWVRVWGPGRVAMSSKFERLEKTGSIQNTSSATVMDWNQAALATVATRSIASVTQAMSAGPAVDQEALRAKLDAVAASGGLEAVASSAAGSGTLSYHYATGPAAVSVEVSAGAANAMLSGIGSALNDAGLGNLGTSLSGLLGKVAARTTGGGAPVEGLGERASYRLDGNAGDLVAFGSGRQVHVRVTGWDDPQHLYGWAYAFAQAAFAV